MIRLLVAAALIAAASTAAPAAPLTIVEVGAPAINCVFNPTCTIVVNDSASPIPILTGTGAGFFQSRTFPPGVLGTPGAGKTAYVYRLDMRQAAGAFDCIGGLVMNFGPVTKLPYKPGFPPADVFVITSGGIGTIGLKSADQSGDIITFEFAKQICFDPAPDPKNTTFFFGLAATTPPKAIMVHIYKVGDPPFIELQARVPNH